MRWIIIAIVCILIGSCQSSKNYGNTNTSTKNSSDITKSINYRAIDSVKSISLTQEDLEDVKTLSGKN